MSAVIMIEIIVGVVLLAAAVRFAVRDTQQRRSASLEPQSLPADRSDVPAHVSSGEHAAEAPLSEATDQA
ncbi:MAG: hypothetical protein JO115_06830 [Pseudonocardiales bacterium]|nr:hypothetical protein [Pseudonocardiales bacterium]